MKNLFLTIVVVFLVFACNTSETNEVPKDVLSEDKMTEVLIDVHIAEAAIALKGLPSDSARIVYTIQQERIFDKHDISKQQFDSSYTWYVNHPEVMDQLYTAVVDSLSLREGRGVIE